MGLKSNFNPRDARPCVQELLRKTKFDQNDGANLTQSK